jgi:hypothetical protein
MKTIPLTQGKAAIVDDDDYERLSQYKWCAHYTGHEGRLARNIRRETDE